MDAQTYTSITTMCGLLAGRLSDETLGTIREHYAAGEWSLADATLLLNLAHEGVGVTRPEQGLIRSFLTDPTDPDLLDVPIVDEVELLYRFGPTGPASAPDPSGADVLLSTDAPRHEGRRLHRTWREPLVGARGAAWVYVLHVAEDADALQAYSGLTSRLWSVLKKTWPLEVVAEGSVLSPYQAAALSAARRLWTAEPSNPHD